MSHTPTPEEKKWSLKFGTLIDVSQYSYNGLQKFYIEDIGEELSQQICDALNGSNSLKDEVDNLRLYNQRLMDTNGDLKNDLKAQENSFTRKAEIEKLKKQCAELDHVGCPKCGGSAAKDGIDDNPDCPYCEGLGEITLSIKVFHQSQELEALSKSHKILYDTLKEVNRYPLHAFGEKLQYDGNWKKVVEQVESVILTAEKLIKP